MMRRPLAGLMWVLTAAGLIGCGEAPSAKKGTAQATNSGSGNPLTAPVDYLGAVGAAQKQAARTVDLTTLQQAIQAFQAGEDRLPSNLTELVSEGYLPRLPAPPKGMEWGYQPHTGKVRLFPLPPEPPRPGK